MRYTVEIKEQAQYDLKRLLKYEPKVYQKALRFIDELREHPKTGLGHPEPLKGKPEVVVLVLAAYGHYEDK